MRFSTYFILISYLMAGIGLIAVYLTSAISPLVLAGMSAIAILNLFMNIRGKHLDIPKFIWNLSAAVILVMGLTDYFLISGSLIEVSVRFLTVLLVIKLFDLRTNRDYTTLYLLTFFQLLAASASTINLSFLFVLALYTITVIWAMTIFNLKKEWEEQSLPDKEAPRGILTPSFFLITSGLAAVSLVITLSLFFIIPRMGIGFFPKKTAETVKVSGFSETIDLGEIGAIKLDSTIVMRVEFQPPSAGLLQDRRKGLYFRGMSFDAYNGLRWQQTLKEIIPLRKGHNGIFAMPVPPTLDKEHLLTQNILLEPIETNVLFAASFGTGIAGNFRTIATDRAGSLYLPAPFYSRTEYTAYSDISSALRRPALPVPYLEEKERYLQLPEGLGDVQALAERITAGQKTDIQKISAVEEYLKNNYRYTLNPRTGQGKNPLEDFLFYTKEGYCEQYATAMVIMLRTIGIPSRLVTGFLPGEWNGFGSYFIIRQSDAHSWVEAYTEDLGWVTFDPTPSAETTGESLSPTPIITLYIDSLRWKWNRYIINYSFADQLSLARTVEGKSRSVLSKLNLKAFKKDILKREAKQTLIMLIVIAVVALTTILLRRVWKRKTDVSASKTPRFYKDMLRILAEKGKIKNRGDTPAEFADTIALAEVKDITRFYHEVRFGGYKLSEKERNKISFYLKTIQEAQL